MATFHFTDDSPPNNMFNDVQIMNRFGNDQFQGFLGILFAFLAEPTKSGQLIEQLEKFAEHHNVNATGLKTVIKTAISVPNCALRRNLSATQLREDLVNLGFSEEKAVMFADKFQTNLVNLSKSALGQTLMVNQLVDMEWKFGVTAASSEVNKVGNTFLQMKMTINKGSKNEDVYMELTLQQFYDFLHQMERAKASLDMLS